MAIFAFFIDLEPTLFSVFFSLTGSGVDFCNGSSLGLLFGTISGVDFGSQTEVATFWVIVSGSESPKISVSVVRLTIKRNNFF